MSTKCGQGSVEVGETGKKAKTTPDADGKSVSAKSQTTRRSSSHHTEYFVREGQTDWEELQ